MSMFIASQTFNVNNNHELREPAGLLATSTLSIPGFLPILQNMNQQFEELNTSLDNYTLPEDGANMLELAQAVRNAFENLRVVVRGHMQMPVLEQIVVEDEDEGEEGTGEAGPEMAPVLALTRSPAYYQRVIDEAEERLTVIRDIVYAVFPPEEG